MTTYTINGVPLPYGSFIDAAGVTHPANILDLWTDHDLAAIGVERVPSPAPSLEDVKRHIRAAIDRRAEIERALYITPGAGQAMTYTAKAAEAARYIETSGVGDYPLLRAEVGITGETLHQVAQVVANLHAQWQVVGGLIERARLAAKAAVDAAEDEATARAVIPVWPSP